MLFYLYNLEQFNLFICMLSNYDNVTTIQNQLIREVFCFGLLLKQLIAHYIADNVLMYTLHAL